MDKFERNLREFERDHHKTTLFDFYDLADEVKFSKCLAAMLIDVERTRHLLGFIGASTTFKRHEVDTEIVNIDVLIRTYEPDQEIIVENKIFSDESVNQISKYVDKLGGKSTYALFVTPDGRCSKSYEHAKSIKITDLLDLLNYNSDSHIEAYRYAMSKIVSSTENDAKLLSLYDEFPDTVSRMLDLVNKRQSDLVDNLSSILSSFGYNVLISTVSRVQFRSFNKCYVNESGSGSFANDPSLARFELYFKNQKDCYIKYIVGPGDGRGPFIEHLIRHPSKLFSTREKIGSTYTQVFSELLGSTNIVMETIKSRRDKYDTILEIAEKYTP